MFIVVNLRGAKPLKGTVEHVCLQLEVARTGVDECKEAYHYAFLDEPQAPDIEFHIYELPMALYSLKVGDEVCVAGLTETK